MASLKGFIKYLRFIIFKISYQSFFHKNLVNLLEGYFLSNILTTKEYK